MELTRYENTFAPHLCALLEGDRYAFAVMGNILSGDFGPVSRIVTDGARLILCYTYPPFPGWIWLPEDADEAEMARAWALIQRELPMEEGYRVNMRPALAAYILSRPEGTGLRMDTQLDAYGCDAVVPMEKAASGDYFAVGMEALDGASDWLCAMKQETGLDPMPLEGCREEMQGFIARKRLFVWKKPDGEAVAMCAVTQNGELGYIGHVYTPKAHRRQGYAISLVYHVTRALLAQGMQPALCVVSTNRAAAACYARLGYRIRGSFCTVGK